MSGFDVRYVHHAQNPVNLDFGRVGWACPYTVVFGQKQDVAASASFIGVDMRRSAVDYDKMQASEIHLTRIAEECGEFNRYISMATTVAGFVSDRSDATDPPI